MVRSKTGASRDYISLEAPILVPGTIPPSLRKTIKTEMLLSGSIDIQCIYDKIKVDCKDTKDCINDLIIVLSY